MGLWEFSHNIMACSNQFESGVPRFTIRLCMACWIYKFRRPWIVVNLSKWRMSFMNKFKPEYLLWYRATEIQAFLRDLYNSKLNFGSQQTGKTEFSTILQIRPTTTLCTKKEIWKSRLGDCADTGRSKERPLVTCWISDRRKVQDKSD